MIFDRPYMRQSNERPSIPALGWLIISIIAVFVVENIFVRWFHGDLGQQFIRFTALSPEGLKSGFVWTLASHGWIHHPDNLLSLVFTLLALFVFGRSVVEEIGPKRFLGVFIGAVTLGGLTWLAVNWSRADTLFGASAGVSAMIVLFACLNPEQPITLFLVDVGMRAKHLALGLFAIDVLGLVLVEIPGRSSWFSMAHSAHLGGMAAGWIYFRMAHQGRWLIPGEKPTIELPGWARKARKTDTSAPVYKINLSKREDLKAEVDRILDKINSEGFQSLTAEEKRHLDQARELLGRR